jgi:hypothetical protein
MILLLDQLSRSASLASHSRAFFCGVEGVLSASPPSEEMGESKSLKELKTASSGGLVAVPSVGELAGAKVGDPGGDESGVVDTGAVGPGGVGSDGSVKTKETVTRTAMNTSAPIANHCISLLPH